MPFTVVTAHWRRARERVRRWRRARFTKGHDPRAALCFELVQQTREIILLVRPEDGRLLEVNPAACEAYGYSREELLERTIHDLRAPEAGSVAEEQPAPAEASEEVLESIHRRKDGSAFPVEVSSRCAVLGETRALVSVVRDITLRKRSQAAELELREQAEQRAAALDAILQSVAEPLGVTDAQGVLVRTNPAFERLFGPQESWRGMGIVERAGLLQVRTPDGEVLPMDRLPSSRALAGDPVSGQLHQLRAADGSVRHVSTSAAPIRTTAGVIGAVLVFADLTDRVLAEQALRDADRRKNRFLAVLSHELRNPLAPIRNCLFLLERAAPGSDQARLAQQILERQVGVLSRLVEDLLDVTRITSGKIQLQQTVLDLGALLGSVVEDHRTVFEQAGVELDFLPVKESIRVSGDRVRLTQAVGNLVQNAAKFTPRGGLVTAALEADRTAGRAVIRIADAGIGMTPELLARLFEPFSQAEDTLDRRGGGLGLGLALVKGLVELHGGEVQATSDGPGRGAEFTLRIPLVEEEARPADAFGSEAKAGRRVLIIEDNPDTADSLREVLQFLGDHQVDVAHSGPEGVARARELKPEVVFCDIGLPGMNGYEVARALRADATLGSAFLVALSGYAYPEDLERSRSAGFERHLAKPPTMEALAELLDTAGVTRRDVQ